MADTLTRRSLVAGFVVAAGLAAFGIYSYISADERTKESPIGAPAGSRWVSPDEARRLQSEGNTVELRLVAPADEVSSESAASPNKQKD